MRGIGKLYQDVDKRKLWVRRGALVLMDAVLIAISGYLALLTRFEFIWNNIDKDFLTLYLKFLVPELVVTLGIFWVFRLYHSLWFYASMEEAANVCGACVLSTILEFLMVTLSRHYLPRSFYPLNFFYMLVGVLGIRVLYRFIRLQREQQHDNDLTKNVMIIGAGMAGRAIMKEIFESKYLNYRVRCLIDDDPQKIGNYIHRVKIVGNRSAIKANVKKYDISLIIIAIPSESKMQLREILNICKETDCELKILPGIYQLVNDEVKVSNLRKVDINDLLGRDPVVIESEEVSDYLYDKVVLVTGGGGSIGSELCRQIALRRPRRLIIVDIYENNAYDIQQELLRKYPDLNLTVLIGSVRNEKRIFDIFDTWRPQVVFHAAAHKHVPLMEVSPDEAIKNNVAGTLTTVRAADRYGVERFVLISTDKAVNPTNVMGASKRLCEMIVQLYNGHSRTKFVAVRFGNVLGSNGSVIPLFQKQIREGGPITVTDPEIIRYFMTIPEAVSLVLQSCVLGEGGEIFVLDMGEPVKILDLAKNMIRLSGLKLDRDIEIVFTGLRPGEKLYEELLMDEEGLMETKNKKIRKLMPAEMDEKKFCADLDFLIQAAEREQKDIPDILKGIVPTYMPKD